MINKVILVGHVGKDPEVRYIDNGAAVAQFSLATNETYKDKTGNRVEKTEWHNIVLWRGLAEVVEKYVKKGDQLYIEGKIRTRSYDDKDGNKKYITEIVADTMQMMGKKGSGDSKGAVPSPQSEDKFAHSTVNEPDPPLETDDLPF
jgi:single-strand DNA-binding protein